MKIAVFSDSHGFTDNMKAAVRECRPDLIIHLGDLRRDASVLDAEFPTTALLAVPGNCDLPNREPDTLCLDLEGVRIFLAHGHRHGVKMGLDAFLNSVYCSGSALGLYGHTHAARITETNGLTAFNPGACGAVNPSYGIVMLQDGKFDCRIVRLNGGAET
ncbi:MAG: metallophosphatase family protein [Oscillospiraceae bacterium]|nr:metallophosphatase family protein [Oscillospiraceae bacterium]